MDLASLDPVTTALVIEGLKTAIRQAWAFRTARVTSLDVPSKELDDAYQLALRLLASLLHETRANIERMRFMSESFHKPLPNGEGEEKTIALGVFDFSVSDALLPELCRVVPSPEVLERCRSIISAARRADFYIRIAAAGPVDRFGPAIAFCDDAINKKVIDRFNTLVSLGHELASSVFADNTRSAIDGLFPDPINPSESVRDDDI